MKKCKECGLLLADDAIHCPNCEGNREGYCCVCGTKLTKAREQKQGICANCQPPATDNPDAGSQLTYLGWLRAFEILCYICGGITILALVMLERSDLLLIGIIAIIPLVGMGLIFGALREILKRIK